MYGNAYGNACGNALKLVTRFIIAYPYLLGLKIAIPFSNLNFSHVERATTHYQTLQTWIGLNITPYHKLNALPHALPNIFSEIYLVLDYLQRVTTHYCQCF